MDDFYVWSIELIENSRSVCPGFFSIAALLAMALILNDVKAPVPLVWKSFPFSIPDFKAFFMNGSSATTG